MQDKKTILSGIQATGVITLGNYLGAMKNWVALQEEYNCLYCVVDLHSVTVRREPAELRRNSLDLLKIFIASGIDPERHLLFFQSHVSAHAELAWVLSCYTQMGELARMTQFKDKSQKNKDNINAGLFTYPVLMAADILVYQADLVPVGADQKQHLELTRDIAVRFNGLYGDTFKVPEPYIGKQGARIMSLQNPQSKMSKSDPNPKGYISVLDSPDVIRSKIRSAVTDSEGMVAIGEGRHGINNLINIYCSVTGKTPQETEAEFSGLGYGAFKNAAADAIVDELAPLQRRFKELGGEKTYLEEVYRRSAERARNLADRTVAKVYRRIGFVNK